MAAKLWLAGACLFVALSSMVFAQDKKPLTNQDVLAMVHGGLDESTILMAIQANPSEFDVSVPALIDLKTQKVSETLIRAIVAAEAQKRGESSGVANHPRRIPQALLRATMRMLLRRAQRTMPRAALSAFRPLRQCAMGLSDLRLSPWIFMRSSLLFWARTRLRY